MRASGIEALLHAFPPNNFIFMDTAKDKDFYEKEASVQEEEAAGDLARQEMDQDIPASTGFFGTEEAFTLAAELNKAPAKAARATPATTGAAPVAQDEKSPEQKQKNYMKPFLSAKDLKK